MLVVYLGYYFGVFNLLWHLIINTDMNWELVKPYLITITKVIKLNRNKWVFGPI